MQGKCSAPVTHVGPVTAPCGDARTRKEERTVIRRLMARLGWGGPVAQPAPQTSEAASGDVIPLDRAPSERDIRGIHGAHLLWVIRDNLCQGRRPSGCQGTMLHELCQRFNVPWNPFEHKEIRVQQTGHMGLFKMLRHLMEVGFVEFRCGDGQCLSRIPTDHEAMSGGFLVTEKWVTVQQALGVSLKELARLLPGSGGVVQPLFGPPASPATGPDVYVIMPFAAKMRPIYADHIRPVVEGLGYKCMRGDDELSTHVVMDDIWRHITSARLLVAECSGRNPNVFYEIGIAHAVGMPVIILAQDGADVPFDVKHIRFIQYAFSKTGLAELDQKVARTIRSEMNRLDERLSGPQP